MAQFNWLTFGNNPQRLGITNMTQNPVIINTSVPPPMLQPTPPSQYGQHQGNINNLPPSPQQSQPHMFTAGPHVQDTNPSQPFISGFPINLMTPPPTVSPGVVFNSQQNYPRRNQMHDILQTQGNLNNQNIFPGEPSKHGNMHFQIPTPLFTEKRDQPAIWNCNGPVNNSTDRYFTNNNIHTESSNSITSNNCILLNQSFPFSSHAVNRPNVNGNHGPKNWFTNQDGRNRKNTCSPRKIQTTSVPDSSVFCDPSAVFNLNRNNDSESIKKVNNAFANSHGNTSTGYSVNNSLNSYSQNIDGSLSANQCKKGNFGNNHWNKKRPISEVHDINDADKKIETNSIQHLNNHNSFHNKKFNKGKFTRYFYNSKNVNVNNGNNFNLIKTELSYHSNLIDVPLSTNGKSNRRDKNRKQPLETFELPVNQNSFDSEILSVSDSESREYLGSNDSCSYSMSQTGNGFNSSWHRKDNNCEHKKSWMSESIQTALKKRNSLFNQAKQSQDPALWDEYNALKNQINEDIRKAKANCKNDFKKQPYQRKQQQRGKDLPFSCDTCDRSFATDSEYKEHCALHVKCYYAGCNFKAHPKVVALHQKIQHDTGYAEQINKLQNEEDIKKWREERKKRFPTAENILRHKAEEAEKKERGEVVEAKDFGKFKKQKLDENSSAQDHLHHRQRRQHSRARKRSRKTFDHFQHVTSNGNLSDSEEEGYIKLPRFKGMKAESELLSLDTPSDMKKDSDEEGPEEVPIVRKPLDKQDDEQGLKDSEVEGHEEIPFSRKPLEEYDNLVQDKEQVLKDSDEEGPEEIPVERKPLDEHGDEPGLEGIEEKSSSEPRSDRIPLNDIKNALSEEANATASSSDNKDKSRKKRYEKDQSQKQSHWTDPPRQEMSLLKMLLDDEIRHERNVIMQCVRYIVQNNFFDDEQSQKNC